MDGNGGGLQRSFVTSFTRALRRVFNGSKDGKWAVEPFSTMKPIQIQPIKVCSDLRSSCYVVVYLQ